MADSGSIKTFFGSDMFDELYLWLHREKTPYTALNSTTKYFGINYTLLGVKKTLSDYSYLGCLLYTSPSPRDGLLSRMPSSA